MERLFGHLSAIERCPVKVLCSIETFDGDWTGCVPRLFPGNQEVYPGICSQHQSVSGDKGLLQGAWWQGLINSPKAKKLCYPKSN